VNTDIKIINAQLGRDISGFNKIEVTCMYGFPQVISTYPMMDGKLFPTLYWLTCPYIKKQIGRLEEQGMIKKISEKINNSSDLKQKYIDETMSYIEKRIELFKETFPQDKIPDRIKNSGIGGIQDWREISGLKCIHLHFAYYLVNNKEIIGNIIKHLIKPCCPDSQCSDII